LIVTGNEKVPDQPILDAQDAATPTAAVGASTGSLIHPSPNMNDCEQSTNAYSHMTDSTDGEACFPSINSPFDQVSEGGTSTEYFESDSEYPSDGSTYGSTNDSDDEENFDESETEAGSQSSDDDSYDMADIDWSDTPGVQNHAGDNNKGKRIAAATNHNYGNGGSLGRRKGPPGGDDGADGRRKRQRGGNGPRPNRSLEEDDTEKLPLACPYYKHSPGDYTDCMEWSDRSLSRVKSAF
jgi:hypothetical protein